MDSANGQYGNEGYTDPGQHEYDYIVQPQDSTCITPTDSNKKEDTTHISGEHTSHVCVIDENRPTKSTSSRSVISRCISLKCCVVFIIVTVIITAATVAIIAIVTKDKITGEFMF